MKTILPVLVALTIASCTRQPGSAPLDRSEFAAVYTDVTVSLWKARRAGADTTVLSRITDSVLALHNTTREQYLATLRWFNEDVERWKGFYDEVSTDLEERAKKEAQLK